MHPHFTQNKAYLVAALPLFFFSLPFVVPRMIRSPKPRLAAYVAAWCLACGFFCLGGVNWRAAAHMTTPAHAHAHGRALGDAAAPTDAVVPVGIGAAVAAATDADADADAAAAKDQQHAFLRAVGKTDNPEGT